tara:strand:+ start:8046 stop:8996 length:951 start_codon:yes stop_codon:yes gene_type:complete
MRLVAYAGKGGIGKTTCAVGYSVMRAQDVNSVVIDYDGGHSVPFELGMARRKYKSNEFVQTPVENLRMGVLDPYSFKSVLHCQNEGIPTKEYIKQFKEDYGLLPICDMVASFFGVPTDPDALSQFISYARLVDQADKEGVEQFTIDIEPTAGLQRLLKGTGAIMKSIDNIRNPIKIVKWAIQAGWPDIAEFIQSEYLKEGDEYFERFANAAEKLSNAKYFVGCNPKWSTIHEMKKILDDFDASIMGFVVNDIKMEDDNKAKIAEIEKIAKSTTLIYIHHDPLLDEGRGIKKREALLKVGRTLNVDTGSDLDPLIGL